MGTDHGLDLARRHLLTASVDHLRTPADETQGAVEVAAAQVARVQPAVVVQRGRGLLRAPDIAEHERRRATQQLARLVRIGLGPVRPHDAHGGMCERPADAHPGVGGIRVVALEIPGFRPTVDAGLGDVAVGLGLPVGDDEAGPEGAFGAPDESRRHGGATGHQYLKGAHVVPVGVESIEQVEQHRRYATEEGDALIGEDRQHPVDLVALAEHVGRGQDQTTHRRQHTATDVEQGRHVQPARGVAQRQAAAGDRRRRRQPGVGQLRPLRASGRPRRVLHLRHVARHGPVVGRLTRPTNRRPHRPTRARPGPHGPAHRAGRGIGAIVEQAGGIDVAQQVGRLVDAEGRIDRRQHQPGQRHAELQDDPLGAVAGPDRDHLARAELVHQAPGRTLRRVPQLGIRQPADRAGLGDEDERLALGRAVGGALQQLADGSRHR